MTWHISSDRTIKLIVRVLVVVFSHKWGEESFIMPKDRLAAMQQKAGGDDEDFAVPVDDEMEGAMKDFFKEIEEIRSNCDKIDNKIKDVKKLQSEILSSPNVDQKMQSQMDDYMADIKKVANSVRTKWVEHKV